MEGGKSRKKYGKWIYNEKIGILNGVIRAPGGKGYG